MCMKKFTLISYELCQSQNKDDEQEECILPSGEINVRLPSKA